MISPNKYPDYFTMEERSQIRRNIFGDRILYNNFTHLTNDRIDYFIELLSKVDSEDYISDEDFYNLPDENKTQTIHKIAKKEILDKWNSKYPNFGIYCDFVYNKIVEQVGFENENDVLDVLYSIVTSDDLMKQYHKKLLTEIENI